MVQVASFITVSFVSDVLVKYAIAFFLEGSLQPSQMLVGYATNIRIGYKTPSRTNTLSFLANNVANNESGCKYSPTT
jgi:hypothetical protein